MSIDPSIPPPTPPPSIPAVPPPVAASEAVPADAPQTTPAESSNSPAAAASGAPAVAPAGDNTVAFLCYLTLIGFVVAIVINKDEKKNSLGNFHLRQMLGLLILGIGGAIAAVILGIVFSKIAILVKLVMLVYRIFWLGLVVAWIMGFIDALNRREKPIPVIGPIIQDKLKNVFAS